MKTILAQIRTEDYYYCKEEAEESVPTFIEEAIADSVVLDELTNGEVLMKMFPGAKITEETYVVFMDIEECNHPFDKAWWNSKWGGLNNDCSTID